MTFLDIGQGRLPSRPERPIGSETHDGPTLVGPSLSIECHPRQRRTVQIKDYLRDMRRRASILIVLPLLAGGVGLVFVMRQPQRYEASVTLVAPGASSTDTSPAAILQSVSDYRAGLTSPPVLERVSKATGEPAGRIKGGLQSSQLAGSSSIVETTYTGSRPQLVTEVVAAVARESLAFLRRPQLQAADLAAAMGEEQAARDAVNEFRKSSGLFLPTEDYRAKAAELSQLNLLLQQAKLQGSTTRISALEQAVDATSASLAEIGVQVAVFEPLEDRLEKARDNLSRARSEPSGAALASADQATGMEVQPATPVPRLPNVFRRTAAVMATALFVAIGTIVVLEELSSSRERKRQPADPEQEDANTPLGRNPRPEPATPT